MCVLGWLTHAALQIAKKTEDLSAFYMEQPCQTYEECLTVRKHTNLPFVIDESVTDLQSLVKGSGTFQPQTFQFPRVHLRKVDSFVKFHRLQFCKIISDESAK